MREQKRVLILAIYLGVIVAFGGGVHFVAHASSMKSGHGFRPECPPDPSQVNPPGGPSE